MEEELRGFCFVCFAEAFLELLLHDGDEEVVVAPLGMLHRELFCPPEAHPGLEFVVGKSCESRFLQLWLIRVLFVDFREKNGVVCWAVVAADSKLLEDPRLDRPEDVLRALAV